MKTVTADKLPNMHSTDFRGIPIVIQWPKGSTRVGETKKGEPYKTEMKADYGYIPDTIASGDEERLDVYVEPNKEAEYAYVVEQNNNDGTFDEYKIMLGFDSLESAQELYEAQINNPHGDVYMEDISEVPFDYLFDVVKKERTEELEQEREETGTEIEQDEKKIAKFLRVDDLEAVGRGEKTAEEVLDGDTLGVRHPDGETIPLKDLVKSEEKMSIIDAFIKLYKHEVDFYTEVARLVAKALEDALQESGIHAIVTYRAKKPRKLKTKLLKRNDSRQYQSFRDIYDDIVDLAGVRVALYLPAGRDVVGTIIERTFALMREAKQFPRDKGPQDTVGYVATHYLVQLRPETLHKDELRYADTNVEIQVASVLMHAWAEITHDLIYKPQKGSLTPNEIKMITDLNEIVKAGESVLEELQESVEARNNGTGLRFELRAALSKLAHRLKAQSNGTAFKRVTAADVKKLAEELLTQDVSKGLIHYLQGLGWKNQGFNDWSHPNKLQEVVQVFPDGWIHRSWDKIESTGDSLEELQKHLVEAGLAESYNPPHVSYLRAKLALWKAHKKADENDDRLRAFWKSNEQKPVGDTNRVEAIKAPDDKFIEEAKTQLGHSADARLTADQLTQVLALAQTLKQQPSL